MLTDNRKVETVSVIIPILNEERYIEALIESILQQDYNFEKLEIIFVDGNSKDNTVNLINERLKNKKLEYKTLYNKEKITPKSVNMGIKKAKNDIIIRLDAHSEYPNNYVSKCVYYLNNTDADNVGCLTLTKGENTVIGRAISSVLTSTFGVGNSKFRLNAKSGYVDTVPYGAFRKELFNKIGYFNEELLRSEDNEINYRIRKNGGKVYLFDDIGTTYHPRDSIQKLLKMAYQNGKYATYTGYIIPGSMGIRHFVPFIFVISLIVGIAVSIARFKISTNLFLCELLLYLILDLIFSFKNKKNGILSSLVCIILYPLFHISYGIGSFAGIGKIMKNRKRTNNE